MTLVNLSRCWMCCAGLALAAAAASHARANGARSFQLANPAGPLTFELRIDAGVATYEIRHRGRDGAEVVVIERSRLGLTRSDVGFTEDLALVSASASRLVDETYRLITGKQREIRYQAVEQIFTLANATGAKIALTVRVTDDGVAFRYGFAESSASQVWITGESTAFDLPSDGIAWMLPYEHVGDWSPAYEGPWRNRLPIGTRAPNDAAGWSFPALFHINNRWVLLTEAAFDGTCYGAHLAADAENGCYRLRLPEEAETYGVAPQAATAKLPWQSPWRIIVVGDSPATIVETNLVTHLAPPCAITDSSWIKPGHVSWSWWSDKGSPRDYHRIIPFIDLAADYGWEYSLIDANWDEMRHGDIRGLIDYAKSRNVGLILWYNSGGPHNQISERPRGCMDDAARREAEMAKLESWGVKGIKVDFFQSDKQYMMQLYVDILRDAAKHHLVVDFHGCTMPRGWARTWPNLLTQEAVRGAEQYWDPEFATNAHTYHTIYPFTRNVVGSMDYTPVIFGLAPELELHQTTNAHELATAVVFESGLQHFADSVSAYCSQLDYVQDFLRTVPVAWDETRYLDGFPGEFVLLARRRDSTWYVGGLNGRAEPRSITVPLAFLGPGSSTAEFIVEGAGPRKFGRQQRVVSASEHLTFDVPGRGGFVGTLSPITP